MASSRKVAGNSDARSARRIIRIAPVTRAVRVAMAASATALLLAGTGVAYAGQLRGIGQLSSHCVDVATTATQPVVDLTRVTGGALPSSVSSQSAAATPQLVPGVTITNTSDITVLRPDDAFGLEFTSTGPVTVRNSGALDITSTDALADGIFVSGSDVLVRNSGQIDASGDEWAAGIEAQGSDHARVINRGAITATAAAGDPVFDKYGYGYVVGFTNGGAAYGVYATGGADGTVVTNTTDGRISATGAFAQGIHAYNGDGTSVRVGNAGQIGATGYYASGIVAASPVEGSVVRVHNSGDIDAGGQFGATGIDALATGVGSSVHVTNSGTIDAYAASTYLGSGAGILATADGDATVGNSGVIVAGAYFGSSYGVWAASLAGTARVTNTGDITVVGGYGVLSTSTNGRSVIDNRGDVTVTGGNFGLIADGGAGARVHNAGTVSISDGKYNFALQATSSLGDVDASNSGTLVAGLDDGSDKYAFGMLALARTGDTLATNRGAITTTGYYSFGDGGGLGLRRRGGAQQRRFRRDRHGHRAGRVRGGAGGTTTITNTGHIAAQGIDYAASAIGVLGRSYGGDVSIRNRGDITRDQRVRAGAWRVRAGRARPHGGQPGRREHRGDGDRYLRHRGRHQCVLRRQRARRQCRRHRRFVAIRICRRRPRLGLLRRSRQPRRHRCRRGRLRRGSGGRDRHLRVCVLHRRRVQQPRHHGRIRHRTGRRHLRLQHRRDGRELPPRHDRCDRFRLGRRYRGAGRTTAPTSSTTDRSPPPRPRTNRAGRMATPMASMRPAATTACPSPTPAAGPSPQSARTRPASAPTTAPAAPSRSTMPDTIIASDTGSGTSYYGIATGIDAIANAEGGSAAITNSGDISATGYYGGTGIRVTSAGAGASASVDNSGTIHAVSSPDGKYTVRRHRHRRRRRHHRDQLRFDHRLQRRLRASACRRCRSLATCWSPIPATSPRRARRFRVTAAPTRSSPRRSSARPTRTTAAA